MEKSEKLFEEIRIGGDIYHFGEFRDGIKIKKEGDIYYIVRCAWHNEGDNNREKIQNEKVAQISDKLQELKLVVNSQSDSICDECKNKLFSKPK